VVFVKVLSGTVDFLILYAGAFYGLEAGSKFYRHFSDSIPYNWTEPLLAVRDLGLLLAPFFYFYLSFVLFKASPGMLMLRLRPKKEENGWSLVVKSGLLAILFVLLYVALVGATVAFYHYNTDSIFMGLATILALALVFGFLTHRFKEPRN
jgi:hypothetical protein